VTATVTNIFKNARSETGLPEAECKRRWANVCGIADILTEKLCAIDNAGKDWRDYLVLVDEIPWNLDRVLIQFVVVEEGSNRFSVSDRRSMADAARLCHANSLLPVFYTAHGKTLVLPMVVAKIGETDGES